MSINGSSTSRRPATGRIAPSSADQRSFPDREHEVGAGDLLDREERRFQGFVDFHFKDGIGQVAVCRRAGAPKSAWSEPRIAAHVVGEGHVADGPAEVDVGAIGVGPERDLERQGFKVLNAAAPLGDERS